MSGGNYSGNGDRLGVIISFFLFAGSGLGFFLRGGVEYICMYVLYVCIGSLHTAVYSVTVWTNRG